MIFWGLCKCKCWLGVCLTIGYVCAPIEDKFPFYLNFLDKFFLVNFAESSTMQYLNKNGTLDWIMSREENTEIEYGRLFFEIIFVQRKIITIS